MPLQIYPEGDDTMTLGVVGDVDLVTRPILWAVLERAVTEGGIREVVVDLSGVEFLDCHGVGALVQARKLAEKHGTSFRIRDPHGIPLLVLRETNVLGYLSE
jgi:anti-anti-sigma factor